MRYVCFYKYLRGLVGRETCTPHISYVKLQRSFSTTLMQKCLCTTANSTKFNLIFIAPLSSEGESALLLYSRLVMPKIVKKLQLYLKTILLLWKSYPVWQYFLSSEVRGRNSSCRRMFKGKSSTWAQSLHFNSSCDLPNLPFSGMVIEDKFIQA